MTSTTRCSYFVLMKSSNQNRRFPPPWTVEQNDHGYAIKDSSGFALAYVYFRDDLHAQRYSFAHQHLTGDEARRIAKAIARLPEFLKAEPEFPARRVKRVGRYWRSTHPYHVALQDCYVQENYDEIVECCRFNKVPFDATGERLTLGFVQWITYEFAYQFDAVRFWHKFDGRWMLGDDFLVPTPPKDFRPMQSVNRKGAI